MPTINIDVSDDDYHNLQEEYRKMAIAWPRPGVTALPPGFEEWVATRAVTGALAEHKALDEMRIFHVIETLVTNLQAHGFGLAQIGKHGATPAEFAASLVRDLKLSSHQLKRLGELLDYYAKDAKEIADLAHVGITNRAYGALQEAYRELIERTEKSLERLGEQRAVGRIEGALATLVSVNVIGRDEAKEKAEAFKSHVRNFNK